MSKCTACGDKPENTAKDFTKAVIEINNPETLVLLRKVVIPASMGDDTDVVPAVGKYRNVILQYEANGHIYLYSSDGIPTAIEANIPQEVLDQIAELENDVDSLERADQGLQQEIDELKNSPDVVDIVATYADLQAYDTSTLGDKDVIRVLEDETHNNESAYYRWDRTNNQWVFIGAVEGYYTKDQTDDLLDAKQDLLTPGENITIEDESGALVISATDTKYTAGSNVQISPQNVISATDTTYTHFTGATASTDGVQGLVPGPLAGDEDKYLKGDGTWGTVQAGPTVVQTPGTSTTDVMSQNATTSMVFADPGTSRRVKIGDGAESTHSGAISIGWNAKGKYSDAIAIGDGAESLDNHSVSLGRSAKCPGGYQVALGSQAGANTSASLTNTVALGSYSKATRTGEVNVGVPNYQGHGYNNTNYRVIGGVHDGQEAHDAVTKGQLDSIAIQNSGAPTTSTVGTVGQLLEDTTNGKLYICTDATNPYVWEEVGAGGGGGPTVVQTTGASTTDVMSQNAASEMVYAGAGLTPNPSINIGPNRGNRYGTKSITIGYTGTNTGNDSIAMGTYTTAQAADAVAIGPSARANYRGSVAIGGHANASAQGVMTIACNSTSPYGYNNSNYRLLTGLYDPQNDHDAATKGYVDTAVAGAGAATFTTNEWNALWA